MLLKAQAKNEMKIATLTLGKAMERDEESKKGRTHSNTFAYNWLFTTTVSCRELTTSTPNPAMNISTIDPPNARGQINADS